MTKYTKPEPGKVRVRFTTHHTHAGLPFEPGDEITIESHWADSIERLGSGHRIEDSSPAMKAKE
jgi:hypothetical protein